MHVVRLIKSRLFWLCAMIAIGLFVGWQDATAQQPLQMIEYSRISQSTEAKFFPAGSRVMST